MEGAEVGAFGECVPMDRDGEGVPQSIEYRTSVQIAVIDMRRELHLSQERFAHELGVTTRTVSRWEHEASPPDDKIRLLRDFAVSRKQKKFEAAFEAALHPRWNNSSAA